MRPWKGAATTVLLRLLRWDFKKSMKRKNTFFFTVLFCLAFQRSLFAQADSLIQSSFKNIFSAAHTIEQKEIRLSGQEQARIAEKLAEPFFQEALMVYAVRGPERIDGFGLLVDVSGKHGPIAVLVALTPDRRIKGIRILKNREMRGSWIKNKRFLRQFVGKSLDDPIKLNRDIDAVSGATVSSAAVAKAARHALTILGELQLGWE